MGSDPFDMPLFLYRMEDRAADLLVSPPRYVHTAFDSPLMLARVPFSLFFHGLDAKPKIGMKLTAGYAAPQLTKRQSSQPRADRGEDE
jgi:hypothetical protein